MRIVGLSRHILHLIADPHHQSQLLLPRRLFRLEARRASVVDQLMQHAHERDSLPVK